MTLRIVAGRMAALLMCAAGARCGSTPPTQPPPPTLTVSCPQRVEVDSANGEPIVASYNQPTATGGVGAINTTCTPASGTTFNPGTTTVNCQAIDSRGVTAACSTSVFVRIPPKIVANGRVLAFGDSITYGVDAPPLPMVEAPTVPPPPFAYPSQLQGMLVSRYVLQRPVVINEGWPGDKVADRGMVRFRDALLRARPDIVIIMEGTNDTLDFSVGVDRAAAGLRTMIQEAKAQNVGVLLSTIIPERAGPPRPRDEYVPWVHALNDKIRALAVEQNVPLVDMFQVFSANMSLIGNDNVHPTQAGFIVMAKTFAEAIQLHFEQPPPAMTTLR